MNLTSELAIAAYFFFKRTILFLDSSCQLRFVTAALQLAGRNAAVARRLALALLNVRRNDVGPLPVLFGETLFNPAEVLLEASLRIMNGVIYRERQPER